MQGLVNYVGTWFMYNWVSDEEDRNSIRIGADIGNYSSGVGLFF